MFKEKYGEIALLLNVEVDWQLIKAIMPFWNPSYCCFTFNQEDMTSTIEEYSFMLRIEPRNIDKVFWKKVKSAGFKKKLSQLMGLEEAAVEQNIRKKGKSECFAWDFFKRYIAKNDEEDQVLDVFALAIYGLVIFPKVPGHVEVAVIDVIEQIASQANPVPAIVAETLRTLNFCKKNENGNLTCCIQMLYVWI